MSTSPISSDNYLPVFSNSSTQTPSYESYPWGSISPIDEEQDYSFSDNENFVLPKRQRFSPTNIPPKTLTLDRISALPDSILLHILSFLPIERAIATGVLSKRWQYLWTYTPNLHFRNPWRTSHNSEFVRFVDKTLIQCGGAKVDRFLVDFNYDSRFCFTLNLWIRFAVKNNVHELSLLLFSGLLSYRYCYCDHYLLPQHLYKNFSLTKLSLSACDVSPKGRISWKSLRSLSIGCMKLSDDVMQKILSGCPVLESLELNEFYGIDKLNITSPTVKKLVVRDYYGKNVITEEHSDEEIEEYEPNDEIRNLVLEIWGPNLQSLHFLGSFSQNKCRLMNVESLVEANVNFNLVKIGENYHEAYREMLSELLGKLHHVQSLTIGTWCIQVLSTLEKVGRPSPLSKRKTLTLDTRIKRQDLFGITNLLASSPELKTLILNMNPHYKSELCSRIDLLHGISDQKRVFNCLALNLKLVKIVNFGQGHREFELLRFLLENAKVLEKMIIQAPSIARCEIIRTTKELLSYPRASPRAVILFSE
ncbi:hypothetical protein LguiB_034122 [Lonicera macranthoides]